MSRDRPAGVVDRIRGRETIGGIELSRVESGLRAVAAALLLGIAGAGLLREEPLALWLVPVAVALLALEPPRDRNR